MSRIELFKQHLREKRAIKVIAGINNFDVEKVKKVVCAAEQAKASAIDIAADENIIYITKQITDLPVIVSSVDPQKLAMAVELGADALEIGNYDELYRNGTRMSSDEVLEITRKTIELIGRDVFLSVTVPGHLEIKDQIRLAQQLEELGVDLIQTEGSATIEAESAGARGLLEKAQVSIANTVELTRNVEIPVMTASGITSTTAPMAFAAGASAVGIGSCVNKLDSIIAMIAVIRATIESVENLRSVSREEALV